jgi:predicted transcriptional regulator
MPVKQRLSVYLDADMMVRLEKLADKERTAKSAVAEAAIISFLTADDSDRWEAAVTRRMDQLARSVDRMERDLEFSVEALALYIRAWLTATPPLPDNAQAAAQAKGRERYESFIGEKTRERPAPLTRGLCGSHAACRIGRRRVIIAERTRP